METQIKEVPPIRVIARKVRLTIGQIPAQSGPIIRSLCDAMKKVGIQLPGGGMIYVYHGCNGDPAQEFDLEICLPLPPGSSVQMPAPMESKILPKFRCLALDYAGPMSGIGAAWGVLVGQVRATAKPTAESREIYKKWIGFDSADNITELQQGIE